MRELLPAMVVCLVCITMAGGARAQEGAATRQAPASRQGASAQANGMKPGDSSPAPALSRQEERYRQYSRTTSRLRKMLRNLGRLQDGTARGTDTCGRYGEQLRQQIQFLMEERAAWFGTFTEEQKREAAQEIAGSKDAVQKLQELVDISRLELAKESVDPEKVRRQAAKAEAAAEALEGEQQKLEGKIQSAGKGL